MADDFNSLPIGNSIRLGRISKVTDTFVEVEFFDKFISNSVRCPIPHPYSGRGGGVLIGPEKDTMVILANGPMEKWYIVGFVPNIAFMGDLSNASEIRYNESPYPHLGSGEISLKGTGGQYVSLTNNGNLSFDAGVGSRGADIELSSHSNGMFLRTNNIYKFTESGREIDGIIKRDLNKEEDVDIIGSINFLSGESYESFLTSIGRSPLDEVHNRTTSLSKDTVRNPPLIEKRELIYEYANSHNVGNFDKEINAIIRANIDNLQENSDALQGNYSARENRRTDIMDLNIYNFNHLIERVQGTVVDIYGNILDINRNIIKVPEVEGFSANGDSIDINYLRRTYDFLRRSIKYHFEINSRKPISASRLQDKLDGIGKNHSRFSIDIDAEGFTKINIPSTSETGNIPVLSRYFVSRDDNAPDDGSFRDDKSKDIRIAQFGAKGSDGEFSGAGIKDSDYIPETVDKNVKKVKKVTVGTAYHDIYKIANLIFSNGKHGGNKIVSDEINNKIGDPKANAGGRSLQMNTDGSIEMSVGADTVDNKSMVVDLQGSFISHFGRDKNGRSVIHQSDGDILIQIGGKGIKDGDNRFDYSDDRPGRLELHLNRPGAEPQKIVIDEDGMTIDIQGNSVISSSGDMTISAGAKLLLHGDLLYFHGTHDSDIKGTRSVKGVERYLLRNGNISM